jgi:hypothetical protein
VPQQAAAGRHFIEIGNRGREGGQDTLQYFLAFLFHCVHWGAAVVRWDDL